MESHRAYFRRMGTDRDLMERYCQTVINAAESGDDLAAAARVVVGAQMDSLGDFLRQKVMERAKTIMALPDAEREAPKHAAGIGEAMSLLERLSS